MAGTFAHFCVGLLVLQAATFSNAETGVETCETDPDNSGRLMLTPFLKNNDTNTALNLSFIHNFSDQVDIIAHSGYITVNETTKDNVFFLFLRAQVNHSTAPLVLYLKGGPGASALFGQFLETGPLGIDDKGNTFYRNYTLQQDMNVLYLDLPAGSGFSFVDDVGYARELEDVVRDVDNFFVQFYDLFPEYARSPFYIVGEQYGGRAAVMIANHLMKSRPNFKGVILGNIFLGPMIDVIDPSDFLLSAKMLNAAQRETMKNEFEEVRKLLLKNKTLEALGSLLRIVLKNKAQPWRTLFQNLTGYDYQASVNYDLKPPEFSHYKNYANSTNFKNKIHAGENSVLDGTRNAVLNALVPGDFNRDITEDFIDLIESGKEVVFFVGQLNTVVTAEQLENYVEKVVKESYLKSLGDQFPWYSEDTSGRTRIAGYVRTVKNFNFVVMARAGQHAGFDESANYCEMIRRVAFKDIFAARDDHARLQGC